METSSSSADGPWQFGRRGGEYLSRGLVDVNKAKKGEGLK